MKNKLTHEEMALLIDRGTQKNEEFKKIAFKEINRLRTYKSTIQEWNEMLENLYYILVNEF